MEYTSNRAANEAWLPAEVVMVLTEQVSQGRIATRFMQSACHLSFWTGKTQCSGWVEISVDGC